ncbi:MAG TPA: type II toxin-antitoxin system VapC family toxin [Sphingomonas sp.]|jgi:hypothetical protein
MIYCDTSLLVSFLTTEVHTDVARLWLLQRQFASLCISDWVITEVASALAQKRRQGAIVGDQRYDTLEAWSALKAKMSVLPVSHGRFSEAAGLVDSPRRGLRAADALHLAIILDQGCALATFDRDMADAARALGVVVHPA